MVARTALIVVAVHTAVPIVVVAHTVVVHAAEGHIAAAAVRVAEEAAAGDWGFWPLTFGYWPLAVGCWLH